MPNKQSSIVLGLSGGVDSATSAALLIAQGYRVIGVTCRFVDDEASADAVKNAEMVCRHLGIDHFVYDARALFEAQVINPFCRLCAQGMTPSPCVFCNRNCKIPVLLKAADDLGCEKVATGHYARVVELVDQGRFTLKVALDHNKDQSYMLSLLDQDQLSRLVLPLGGYTKQEVRSHAASLGIPVATRPESQDLCFVPGDYRDFLLAQGIPDDPGPIVLHSGKVVGEHKGLHHYTLGQRKGLGVALGRPCFVVEKRTDDNTLVVGFEEESLIDSVEVDQLNWMAFDSCEKPFECSVKIRYRSKAVPCTVTPLGQKRVRVTFLNNQSLTAPGQYAVFYQGDLLCGGGVISSVRFAQTL